ncbi:alpha/beta hydrolase [Pseudanabaena sp. FACHB-2040]|uniref:alpha/beta fold hydrolase n=1 Tax=Pseudanabaena sp. FACHB-2040 TaxID=2692859 RepID=UPI001A7E42D4|nr:alpha/beta hydrolase [Pseudanabaena sp. FACHB-2040]
MAVSMMTEVQHRFIETNGIRLHYVTRGEGPLLLLLHGFPEFWYSWRHQIPEFAQDYTVVALDLRGYNDSDKPEGVDAYRMPELVKDIAGVIRGLGYERCVLAGHDWGGAIAWAFAYEYPELLEALIVLNIPHPARFRAGLQMPQQLLKSSYIGFFQLPVLPELVIQAGDYAALTYAFRGMAVRKDTFSDEDIATYKEAASKPGALTAMLNYYRAIPSSPFFQKSWGILEVPTLMIWGEEDTALSKELSMQTEQYVSDFHLRYIPNCSHWVQQEQPEQVNRYMREFLALERRLHGQA